MGHLGHDILQWLNENKNRAFKTRTVVKCVGAWRCPPLVRSGLYRKRQTSYWVLPYGR